VAGVRLIKVSKRYGKVIAVDNLTLNVKNGEFVTLLGPSGCGKTTTLELIAGLQEPDSGEIYIGDERVTDLPPHKRDVAMVFQNYALYPHMTVYENLAFGLKLRGYPKEEIDRRVKEVAELLHISELLNRKPKELSGGQQQRVALGRAIVRKPKVFLLDEPLSNLDAKLRLYMRAELKKLHEILKATIIYVTHDQAEALSLSDRIAVMNAGKLHQYGAPENIYHKPADEFVASFIGNPPMNLIRGNYEERDEGVFFISEEIFIRIPPPLACIIKEKSTSSSLILGFRPEHIHLYTEADMSLKQGANYIRAKVYAQEPMGVAMLYTLEIGNNLIKAVVPQSFKEIREKEVWILIPEDKMYFFDGNTGKALI